MKKLFQKDCLALAFCLFLSMSAFADVTIDGISYSLNYSDRTATVTGSSLQDVIVPETILANGIIFDVTSVSKSAFYKNSTIKTFKSSSIKEIQGPSDNFSAHGAFSDAVNLEEVYLDNIENIGAGAFYEDTNLKRIYVGNSLKIISSFAFSYCVSLNYIVIPSSITNIFLSTGASVLYGNNYAFNNCPQLLIICLKEGFTCADNDGFGVVGVPQTVYPSSFFAFDENTFNYNGKKPEVNYTFNGIGFGFQPTAVNTDALETIAGEHTSDLTFTITNDDMSFDVDIPYTYTINPARLTAKVNNVSRLYGDSTPQFTSTYTGFVNNEDASVLTSNGSYTTTATANSDVGMYPIKQTGATAQNYVFDYEDGTLTVNKAPLTMSANNKTMTYGSTIPTLDATYEGLKNDEAQPAWINEPSISTTATPTSKVGIYPITIRNAEAKNYVLTVNNGTLTVEKAKLTVKADNKSREYGESNPDLTLTYTGLKNGETVPVWETVPVLETPATIQSPVGSYPISIHDAVAVNYDITPVDGTLTVSKAALQIKPIDVSRKYGEENPIFNLSYVGLRNNETVPEWTTEPVITTSATKTSSVGDYTIRVSSAEARNYTLEKKTGTLTVTKAPLVVGVNSYSRQYGESNPIFELYYEGLVNNETAPQWTTMPTIATEATASSDVGEYAITGTGGVMKNYETTGIISGVLSITPVSLTIRANDISRLYYEDNPEFTFSCTGFVGNDDASALTVKPQMQTSATKNSNVGIYPIEIGNAESKNYTLIYERGQLTINKRLLTVSTPNYTREYGEENPVFVLNYSGFVNNEDESVLILKPKATTVATTNSDVGVYDIVIGNGVAENYDFDYLVSKLTIEKAYQTLTWNQDFSNVRQYDQVELTATASSGLEITYTVQGDQICSIMKIGKKQYLDCFGEGQVVIVAQQEGDNNYWQTTKIYKRITIKSDSVISSITTAINEDPDVRIYDASGNRIDKLQKGINIVKMRDGTTKKVFIR